jgi:hypothetical protein
VANKIHYVLIQAAAFASNWQSMQELIAQTRIAPSPTDRNFIVNGIDLS